MDILRISETPMQDESIEYYETHEYETVTGSSLNNPGELNQLWYKDTEATASIDNNRGFRVRHSYLIESPVPKGTLVSEFHSSIFSDFVKTMTRSFME